MSVRKRCVLDLISITYARDFIGLRYVGSVRGYLGRVLEAAWGRFANFLHPLEPILGSLGRL